MAKRHRVIRRREAVEEIVEPEIEEDEDIDVDTEEEEEDTPPPARRPRAPAPAPAPVKPVKKAPAPVEEEEEEEEEEPKPAKKAPAPAPVPAPVIAKTVDSMVVDGLLGGVMTALADSQSVIITSLGNNKYSVSLGDAAVVAKAGKASSAGKLRGNEYWDTVTSPEYQKWRADWVEKTYDEKVAYAKKIKATWEPHKNPQIDVMRVTDAVRIKLGIEKYKEEYRTRSARAALRG